MFEKLVGNEQVKKYLKETIDTSLISHSYMFIGKEGVGKKLFATEYAKSILCETKEDIAKFDAGSHPDFKIINPEKERTFTIEQVRELQRKIIEKPIIAKKKIYILNDAEKMNDAAQNCLLKTLEEPPEYAMIILIVSNEKLMLPTIKSRCVIVKFGNISKEELIKKGVSEDEALLLDGSFRGIDTISEQIDSFKELEKLVDSLKNDELLKCFKNAKILYENQDNILRFLDYINIIAYNKKIINIVDVVESTKQKIIYNNNYNMTIDYFIMTAYEKLH